MAVTASRVDSWCNQLTALPDWLGNLTAITELWPVSPGSIRTLASVLAPSMRWASSRHAVCRVADQTVWISRDSSARSALVGAFFDMPALIAT